MTTAFTPYINKSTKEQWMPTPYPGFGHYQVSDLGRVKNSRTGKVQTAFLIPPAKYFYVTLDPAKGSGEKRRTIRVARLVYETFFKAALPRGARIQHKNGDFNDCRPVNLEYQTPSAKQVTHPFGGAQKQPAVFAEAATEGGGYSD